MRWKWTFSQVSSPICFTFYCLPCLCSLSCSLWSLSSFSSSFSPSSSSVSLFFNLLVSSKIKGQKPLKRREKYKNQEDFFHSHHYSLKGKKKNTQTFAFEMLESKKKQNQHTHPFSFRCNICTDYQEHLQFCLKGIMQVNITSLRYWLFQSHNESFSLAPTNILQQEKIISPSLCVLFPSDAT